MPLPLHRLNNLEAAWLVVALIVAGGMASWMLLIAGALRLPAALMGIRRDRHGLE